MVAIVTGFRSRLPSRDIVPDNTVATPSDSTAICQAGIRIDHIAIVTGFALLDDAITASRQVTEVAAIVVVDFIAVVARFDTIVDNTVTATRLSAAIRTRVAIDGIGIITRFVTRFPFRQIGPNDAVTTPGILTAVSAGIEIVLIAIIAGFTRLQDLVAACCVVAQIRAVIVVHPIAVVALLNTILDDPITTTGRGTGIRAQILIDTVAIIASLKAFFGREQVRAHKSVATTC